MKKIDIARADIAYLDAYTQCSQLMSKFTLLRHQGKMKEVTGLFARRPDTCFRAVWGTYKGIEGVERCFLRYFGDISDPEYAESYKGLIDFQSMSSEYIVVDDDNLTARAMFTSLGVFVGGKVCLDEDDKGRHFWTMTNTGVDYINENGVWKIWHIYQMPIFFNNYEVRWGREGSKPYERFTLRETTEDCPTHEVIYNYDPHKDVPLMRVPQPYAHWDDIAPGFGL